MLMINIEEKRLCKQLRMLYWFCSNAARILNTTANENCSWVGGLFNFRHPKHQTFKKTAYIVWLFFPLKFIFGLDSKMNLILPTWHEVISHLERISPTSSWGPSPQNVTLRVRSQDACVNLHAFATKMYEIHPKTAFDGPSSRFWSKCSRYTYGHDQNITPVFEARFQQVGTSE